MINSTIRIFYDADYRSILLLLLFSSKEVHQTTSFTYMDRYPEIFSACRDYFSGKPGLKILSYGCSTGEEVLTLRQYFPSAHIVGSDINQHSLAICRKRQVDDKITFVYSKQSEIEKYGPYDAIFCMAVLQRKPHQVAQDDIRNLKNIYPFEKFERQIIELDKLVKPQGLLVVHFAQYLLWDTAIASKYKALDEPKQVEYVSPVFDKNSQIVKHPDKLNAIFVKLGT